MARTPTLLLSPFYPISNQVDTSHRGGWARYWANELNENGEQPYDYVDLVTTDKMDRLDQSKRGDHVLLYHGMEFKGQMNLQSGLTEEILARAKRLIDAKKRGVVFRSIDIPCPRYGTLLAERGMDPTSAEALDKLCSSMIGLTAPNLRPQHLIVGDSHALSLYRPGSTILRLDGQTLHGALQIGLPKLVDDLVAFEMGVRVDKLQTLTAYFGNIDIRHHLMRQPSPVAAMKELVNQYGAQLDQLRKHLKPKVVEVVLPLAIEDESRPIPKSGWYKGAPFAGTWQERHQLRLGKREAMKRMARKHGFELYEHPRHFIGKDGKLTFDVMEKPRSVHIRPAEYRLVQEGGKWLG